MAQIAEKAERKLQSSQTNTAAKDISFQSLLSSKQQESTVRLTFVSFYWLDSENPQSHIYIQSTTRENEEGGGREKEERA